MNAEYGAQLIERLRSYAGTCTGIGPQIMLRAAAERLEQLEEVLDRVRSETPSADEMQRVYDTIITACEHGPQHKRGAEALRVINRLYDTAQVGAHAERGDALAAPFMGDAVGRQADAHNTPAGLWRDRLLMGDCSVRSSTVVRGKL